MDQPCARILVMAKAPVPGHAKTRLEPLLGPAGCARLQAALVAHTVATAAAVAPVHVAVAGPLHLVGPLTAAAPLFPQSDGDLGRRLAAAVTQLRNDLPTTRSPDPWLEAHPAGTGSVDGSRPDGAPGGLAVVVVGTDCPQLGAEHLRAALKRLADGDDVVFGPAHDGGYYLVALAAATPAAPVFDLPPQAWGGPDVLALSLAATTRAHLRTSLLTPEHDLDTPTDATRTRTDPRIPPTIAALLHPPTP